MPYERIVQWSAGPVSVVAGYLSTLLVAKVHILGTLGYTQRGVSGAIVTGATFVVGAGVTYAAHHKWLDNLSKWWNVLPQPSILSVTPVTTETGGATPVGHPVGFTADQSFSSEQLRIHNEVLRQQIRDAGMYPVT